MVFAVSLPVLNRHKMWLSKVADWLYGGINPLIKVLMGIGMLCILSMVFLIFANVVGRYIFNRPIYGTGDFVTMCTGTIAAFGIAYCALTKSHIKVDLIVGRFSPRTQSVIDSIMDIISLGILSLVAWQNVESTIIQFNQAVHLQHIEVPVYLFGGLITFGIGLLTLVILIDLLRNISGIFQK